MCLASLSAIATQLLKLVGRHLITECGEGGKSLATLKCLVMPKCQNLISNQRCNEAGVFLAGFACAAPPNFTAALELETQRTLCTTSCTRTTQCQQVLPETPQL